MFLKFILFLYVKDDGNVHTLGGDVHASTILFTPWGKHPRLNNNVHALGGDVRALLEVSTADFSSPWNDMSRTGVSFIANYFILEQITMYTMDKPSSAFARPFRYVCPICPLDDLISSIITTLPWVWIII